MDREQWLIEAKYLIHVNATTLSVAQVDACAGSLLQSDADLEPDEAVAILFVAFGEAKVKGRVCTMN